MAAKTKKGNLNKIEIFFPNGAEFKTREMFDLDGFATIRFPSRFKTSAFNALLGQMLVAVINSDWDEHNTTDRERFSTKELRNFMIQILEEKFGCKVMAPKEVSENKEKPVVELPCPRGIGIRQ